MQNRAADRKIIFTTLKILLDPIAIYNFVLNALHSIPLGNVNKLKLIINSLRLRLVGEAELQGPVWLD